MAVPCCIPSGDVRGFQSLHVLPDASSVCAFLISGAPGEKQWHLIGRRCPLEHAASLPQTVCNSGAFGGGLRWEARPGGAAGGPCSLRARLRPQWLSLLISCSDHIQPLSATAVHGIVLAFPLLSMQLSPSRTPPFLLSSGQCLLVVVLS